MGGGERDDRREEKNDAYLLCDTMFPLMSMSFITSPSVKFGDFTEAPCCSTSCVVEGATTTPPPRRPRPRPRPIVPRPALSPLPPTVRGGGFWTTTSTRAPSGAGASGSAAPSPSKEQRFSDTGGSDISSWKSPNISGSASLKDPRA